jgi:WD40 repeat protein
MPPPGNKVNATDLSSEELGLIRLWIVQGMKGGAVVENVSEWRSFPLDQAPVTAAALSAGGRIAAAARGNRVQLTEVATGVSLGFLTDPELAKLDIYKDKMPADRDAVMAVSFGGDDLVATGGFRTARIWRRAPLRPQISLELPSTATCLASVESLTAAGNAAGMIHVWDSAAEKPVVEEWKEHAAPVKTLCLSPDRKWLLSAAEDKSFRVWSVSEKKVVFRVEAPAVVTALCFLKSGTELAAGFSDGMLRVYPFTTDSPATPPGALREYKLGDQPVTFLATPDGASTRLIWTNADPAFHLLETADGKRLDVALENPAQAAASAAERRQQAAKRAHDAFKARLAAATDTLKKDTENLRATNGAQEKAPGLPTMRCA